MKADIILTVFTKLKHKYNIHIYMDSIRQLTGSCYKVVTEAVTKLLQEFAHSY